ncbi:MAG: hypothetical protein ISR91_05225 [Candidatus Delongbacteria bacterium]|nr:hypothetical protein [Candidatus Delongbacteria bacterium]
MIPDHEFDYRGVLQSDRLDFFYDNTGVTVELPLPLEQLLNSGATGLEQLWELLRLHLPPDLPSGSLLVRIPPDWGSFTIATPHPVALLRNPLLLCRELELNAPDLPTAYHLDYQPAADGTLILALRSQVLEFIRKLFEPLGFKPTAVQFTDQQNLERTLLIQRTRSWSDLLVAARKRRRPWLPILLLVIIPLLIAGSVWLWSQKRIPVLVEQVRVENVPIAYHHLSDTLSLPLTVVGLEEISHSNSVESEVLILPDSLALAGPAIQIPTLAKLLRELLDPDSIDYAVIIPGWLSWRSRAGRFDSLRLNSANPVASFQQLEQRLLTPTELERLLTGSRLDSAAKIVLFREKHLFNLLWYH